jgi:LAO/AO transport system kinase
MNLAQEVLTGNPRAIAKAITLIENNESSAQELMKEIFPHRKESLIVGITGAPGSGKSTLVDQMISLLRKEGRTIGIVAVDPSSPFSGGAILGDRIRMMRHSLDSEVFIRSMATRGHLGGIAKATGEAIAIFEAAQKDIVLVETVGVGQDEVEVVKLADIVLVILTPGAGDDIQAFKAGIMEIGDIFVINKADSPGIEKTEKQLKAMLELGLKEKEIPAIVKTIATKGKGVDLLLEEIMKFMASKDLELRAARKKRLLSWMLKDIIRERLAQIISQAVKDSDLDGYVEKIYQRELDPYTVAEEIISYLKGSLKRKKEEGR